MDALSVKTQTMKNQLGAALGEVIINITPILLRFIEIIRTAANALAQFFAALGGRGTYLKAVDATADMSKNLGGAGKAAKELRRQLMGFDEINRLDAPSEPSGGGGGGNLQDFSNMFETSPLDSWVEKIAPIKVAFEEMWQALKDGAKDAWDNIKQYFDGDMLLQDVVDTVVGIVEFVTGILSGDWEKAFTGAAKVVDGLGDAVMQTLGFVGDIVDSLLKWLGDLVNSFFDWFEENMGISLDGLRNLIAGFIGSVRIFFKGGWEDIKQIFSGIIDFLGGIFTQDWERMWTGIAEILAGIGQLMVDAFFGVINLIISAINGLTGFANDVISWVGGKFQIGKIGQLNAPRVYSAAFATGGFPEDGLFFANHGELVGQFSNGNTAVANNEQIIQGIERGVYNAMTSALAGQNNGNRDIRVYLDGKQITNAVSRNQRNTERATGVQYA